MFVIIQHNLKVIANLDFLIIFERRGGVLYWVTFSVSGRIIARKKSSFSFEEAWTGIASPSLLVNYWSFTLPLFSPFTWCCGKLVLTSKGMKIKHWPRTITQTKTLSINTSRNLHIAWFHSNCILMHCTDIAHISRSRTPPLKHSSSK